MLLRSSKVQREKMVSGFGNKVMGHRRASDMEEQLEWMEGSTKGDLSETRTRNSSAKKFALKTCTKPGQ